MWDDDCWPPPALTRFAGYRPPPPLESLEYAPSGYDQPLTGASVASPLPVSQDRTVGAFTRDAALPAGVLSIRFQYIPTYAPSGIVGGGLFGGGAIGHRRAYHDQLEAIQVGAFVVYEPSSVVRHLVGADGAVLLGSDGTPLVTYSPGMAQ